MRKLSNWGIRMRLLLILLFMAGSAQAAVVTVDFEGVVGDGDELSVVPYVEDGMIVDSPIVPSALFGKDSPRISHNSNGSAVFGWCNLNVIECDIRDLITLSHQSGAVFDLLSIDASNLTVSDVGDLLLTGMLSSGGTISTTLSLTQNVWSTFVLGAGWVNLDSVAISAINGPLDWDPAIDNIVVNAVPIPAAVWLFGSALAGLGWLRRKQTV
jgi:hypothetical protein